jgi:hypothetical protein
VRNQTYRHAQARTHTCIHTHTQTHTHIPADRRPRTVPLWSAWAAGSSSARGANATPPPPVRFTTSMQRSAKALLSGLRARNKGKVRVFVCVRVCVCLCLCVCCTNAINHSDILSDSHTAPSRFQARSMACSQCTSMHARRFILNGMLTVHFSAC